MDLVFHKKSISYQTENNEIFMQSLVRKLLCGHSSSTFASVFHYYTYSVYNKDTILPFLDSRTQLNPTGLVSMISFCLLSLVSGYAIWFASITLQKWFWRNQWLTLSDKRCYCIFVKTNVVFIIGKILVFSGYSGSRITLLIRTRVYVFHWIPLTCMCLNVSQVKLVIFSGHRS